MATLQEKQAALAFWEDKDQATAEIDQRVARLISHSQSPAVNPELRTICANRAAIVHADKGTFRLKEVAAAQKEVDDHGKGLPSEEPK